MEDQANRPHRKTKEKKKHTGGEFSQSYNPQPAILTSTTDSNPKAFAYANPGRLAKQAVRSHDVSCDPFDLSCPGLTNFL